MLLIRRLVKLFIVLFLICCLNMALIVGLVRYGVFPNTKVLLVTTSMTTLSHQYIASIFADKDEIAKIMNANRVDEHEENSSIEAVSIMLTSSRRDDSSLREDGLDPRQKRPLIIKDTVELVTFNGNGYKAYMFIVTNPKRVQLVATKQFGNYGTKLNTLIKENGGIGGVNAGGFADAGGVGYGGIPTGIVIDKGEIIFKDRNTGTFSLIGLDKRGILILGNYTIEEIKDLDIEQGISFSPFLVVNGKATTIHGDGGWGIQPRTAIGQRDDGTILLLVLDGRQVSSVGATIKEVQKIMIDYGAVNAANLDGGSSTVMYYEGKLINKPCSPAGERPLPTAFIIKAAAE